MENKNLCTICPRACRVDRSKQTGFCGEKEIRIAKIVRHFAWEEPCITGEKGCLAIFFSGCNLRCDYCQNYEISRGGVGEIYSIDEFVKLVEDDQNKHDFIDLVTPTHFSQELCEAFKKIDKKIPVIWNTNSYETCETLEKVSNFVDIFLADFKYSNDELGQKFSKCNNYFSVALPAIQKMCKLKKDIERDGLMQQGVIIRHLVLPGFVQNSIAALNLVRDNFPTRKVSIMSQFTPNGKSSLNRKITPLEYKAVLAHLESLGLANGYVQDFESASECFVPKFN